MIESSYQWTYSDNLLVLSFVGETTQTIWRGTFGELIDWLMHSQRAMQVLSEELDAETKGWIGDRE